MAFRDSESVKIVLFHGENGIRHFLRFKFASETLFPEKKTSAGFGNIFHSHVATSAGP